MTRFARAKGSKSSNERKPEEATSWSEMKKEMLLKHQKTTESVLEKEVKVEPRKTLENKETIETEWGSLGDDSSSLLGRHISKKNCAKKTVTKNKEKKGSLNSSKELNKLESNLSDEQMKSKKKKVKNKEALKESVLNKKGKKRKFSEANDNDSNEFPNKKNKKMPTDKSLEVKNKKDKANKTSGKEKKFKKFEKGDKGDKNWFNSKQEKGRFLNKKFERRPDFFNGRNMIVEEIIVNGEKVPIVKFQGFNVTQEDAERLRKLRQEMIREGIPKDKLEAAIKLERRRAEKALSRLKKAVCFHCRGSGHLLSNCPTLAEKQNTSTGICYKCGSTEHSALECKVVRDTSFQFAECFICKEQGHIARQCPDNPRGLYPQGGACRECGDVTHLRKDCPQVVSKKSEEVVTVGVRRERDFECLDEEIEQREKLKWKKPNKKKSTVKF